MRRRRLALRRLGATARLSAPFAQQISCERFYLRAGVRIMDVLRHRIRVSTMLRYRALVHTALPHVNRLLP